MALHLNFLGTLCGRKRKSSLMEFTCNTFCLRAPTFFLILLKRFPHVCRQWVHSLERHSAEANFSTSKKERKKNDCWRNRTSWRCRWAAATNWTSAWNHTTEAAAAPLEWSLERWTKTFPKLAPRQQQQQQQQQSAKSEKEEEGATYFSGCGCVEWVSQSLFSFPSHCSARQQSHYKCQFHYTLVEGGVDKSEVAVQSNTITPA